MYFADTGEEINTKESEKIVQKSSDKETKWCSHCNEMVSPRTYYYHKSLMEGNLLYYIHIFYGKNPKAYSAK